MGVSIGDIYLLRRGNQDDEHYHHYVVVAICPDKVKMLRLSARGCGDPDVLVNGKPQWICKDYYAAMSAEKLPEKIGSCTILNLEEVLKLPDYMKISL